MKILNFWIFKMFLIASLFCQANDNAAVDLHSLNKFITRAFSNIYIPNSSNKFDTTMAIPSYLGMHVQNTYSYTYEINTLATTNLNLIDIEIFNTAHTIFKTPTGRQIVRSLKQSGIERIHFQIHVVHSENSALNSWTDENFNIHIFLTPKLIKKDQLIKIITHELGQMVSKIDKDHLYQFIKSTFSDIEQIKLVLFELMNSRRFMVTISTLRAFLLESKVMADLHPEFLQKSTQNLSCVGFLKQIALAVVLMNYNFESEQMEYTGYVYDDAESAQLNQLIGLLTDNSKNRLFCEKLISVEFSDKPKSKSGWGPRPNIGGSDGGV